MNHLRQEVISINESKPEVKELIRITGLSRTTINRALNRLAGVHPRTQEVVDNAVLQLASRAGDEWPKTSPRKMKRYVLLIQAAETFTQAIVDEVRSLPCELRLRNCDLQPISCVGWSNEEFARLIRSQREVDGLLVIAKNAPAIVHACRERVQAGTAVVAAHTDLDYPARGAYVGIDNRAAGQTAGYIIGRHLHGTAAADVAVIVETFAYRCHEEREMGFRSVLRQRFQSLNVIDVVKCDESNESTYDALRDLLHRYPNIAGIYNTAGGNRGAVRAIKEQGRAGEIVYVTHELNAVTEALLRRDCVDYIVAQSRKQLILEAIDQLDNLLAKIAPRPNVFIPLEILCRYSLPPSSGHDDSRADLMDHALP